ncbi:hypothetical protein [Caulobacter sp. UNC279MFTsu5.1]|uniref:hypothetical protein n=1 Tax=Caulobacter sp. UNC279MFTsu5.1 TaxID=1502775 RepID=UPI0003826D53|nr:hypothetical protein [Caulobacter sp. UNC279MFTsu5.1]SFI73784.1 hypothetical protein SAMN02799626_00476 [Caulobacter sp. UNC279MFTsu5.1]
MVFLTAGAGWLALLMRAERTRAGREPDAEWLLRGSADPDAVEDDEAPSLAAE